MFEFTKAVPSKYRYGQEALVEILEDLKNAGFSDVVFKLPTQMMKASSTINPDYENVENAGLSISPKTFIDQKKDYPAVLVVGQKQKSGDKIKLLFINTGASYLFDDSLTANNKALSLDKHQIKVFCTSPAEGIGLREFFYELLTSSKFIEDNYQISKIGCLLGWFVIAANAFTLISHKRLLVQNLWVEGSIIIDILLLFFAVLFIYSWIAKPKRGLRLNDRQRKLPTQISNIIKGQFNDNLLVRLAITVLGTVIGGVLVALIVSWVS